MTRSQRLMSFLAMLKSLLAITYRQCLQLGEIGVPAHAIWQKLGAVRSHHLLHLERVFTPRWISLGLATALLDIAALLSLGTAPGGFLEQREMREIC